MPHQRFPKVEILYYNPNDNSMKFILRDTDISMVNTIRRIMIAEVPTLCIDLVEYSNNTSVLNDEYIAHRLGLIPLQYNNQNSHQQNSNMSNTDCSEAFVSHRDCICSEHCSRCSVELTCNVQYTIPDGGGADDDANGNDNLLAPLTVTSRDLVSNNGNVQPAHFTCIEEQENTQDDGIAIVKLGPGQQLHFKAIAYMGISKEHAKWCPVAVATFRYYPIIHINQEQMSTLSIEQKQYLIDTCPDQILELDPVTGDIVPVENYWDIATYTEDLYYAQKSFKHRLEDEDFITITPSTDTFIFLLEGTGAMEPYDIIMSTLKVLKRKLNDIARELEVVSMVSSSE